MKDLPLIIGHLPADFQKKVRDFLALCDDLQNIVDRENEILLDKGTVPFDSFFNRKLQLMNGFEFDIKYIFEAIKTEAPHNICLQANLINIIQNVRRSLCINTTFHLTDLKKRTTRMAQVKDGLMTFAETPEGEAVVCH